jgi:hypothetical protein
MLRRIERAARDQANDNEDDDDDGEDVVGNGDADRTMDLSNGVKGEAYEDYEDE